MTGKQKGEEGACKMNRHARESERRHQAHYLTPTLQLPNPVPWNLIQASENTQSLGKYIDPFRKAVPHNPITSHRTHLWHCCCTEELTLNTSCESTSCTLTIAGGRNRNQGTSTAPRQQSWCAYGNETEKHPKAANRPQIRTKDSRQGSMKMSQSN
jgi:hypothetical protein